MVVMYSIAGRQVGSHWLAMATLGVLFAGSYASMGGGKKAQQGPPINAKSPDEEKFIKEFIANAEAEEKKADKAHAK